MFSEYYFFVPLAIALLLGVMSPGPSFILVSQTAVSRSREAGILVSLGMGTGSLIFTALAAFGFYVVLESVPVLYMAMKGMGGLYLCYLAYKLWKSQPDSSAAEPQLEKSVSRSKFYFSGLFTQLSNPKTALVFASVYATFLPQNMSVESYAMLCALAFAIDTGWYVFVSTVLSVPKSQKIYLKYRAVFNKLFGSVLGFMGVNLILRQN
ncbi:LysE family translocator [Spongorhabdus nitratireducens]